MLPVGGLYKLFEQFHFIYLNFTSSLKAHFSQESMCTTSESGPDPFTKCKFPFTYLSIPNYGCAKVPSPSSVDKICKLLKKVHFNEVSWRAYKLTKFLTILMIVKFFNYRIKISAFFHQKVLLKSVFTTKMGNY